MKRIFSAVLISAALLTGTIAYCNDAKPTRKSTREIPINSAFQKIELGSYLQLVLIQDPAKSSVVIEGDENFIPSVKVSFKNGVLSINPQQNLKGRNVKVYVPVTDLTSLDIASQASAGTEGIVKLDELKVIVHEGSTTALKIIGHIQIEPVDGCDFVYETFKRSKVANVQ